MLPGHPDKLCDAVADGIIDWHRNVANDLQFGLEVACVFKRVFVTGRIANPCHRSREAFMRNRDTIVRDAYASAGYGVDAAGHSGARCPRSLRSIGRSATAASPKTSASCGTCPTTRRYCVGYALRSPETDYLPPAHWLARRIGRELSGCG